MRAPSTKTLVLLSALLGACGGSAAQSPDATGTTAQPLTAGIPRAAWIRLEATTASTAPGTTSDGAAASCAPIGPSTFAPLTMHVTTDANGLLDGLLSVVDHITQSPPTSAGPTGASWGPFGDPRDPVVHRFDLVRLDDHAVHFQLSGKPAGAGDDAWRGLFQGTTAFPGPDARAGDLTVDFAAMHALDPRTDPVSGMVSMHHESSPGGRTVKIGFAGIAGARSPAPNDASFSFAASADGHAVFDFVTRTDFDNDGTLDEVLEVRSRWIGPGLGQSTAEISGGSLGARRVHAVECWAPGGVRTFYRDDAGPNGPAGDPACCPPP